MIAIAPDGTRLQFPDDVTETELDEFLKSYEPELAKSVEEPEPFNPVIPPEREWPRPGVKLMGPPAPEELLTIGPPAWISAMRGGLEEINRVISDVGAQAFQNIGIEAAPQIPIIQLDQYPITAGVPGTIQYAFRQLAPEYAQAADVWAGKTLSGFTEPGMLLQLPFAAWKPVAGKFAADILTSIPETVQALSEAETGPEAFGYGLDLLASGGMGLAIGKQLTRPPRAKIPTREEVLNAVKERVIEENRVRQYPQAEVGRPTPQAGGGYRVTTAAGLEKEAPVLLESAKELGLFQALMDNPGLGAWIEILKDHGPLTPISQ